nr:serine hydrolase [Lewinella cohaerens]
MDSTDPIFLSFHAQVYCLCSLVGLLILFSGEQRSMPLNPTIVAPVADTVVAPLRTLVDEELQLRLDGILNQRSDWKNLISNKKMAVSLVDLLDPEQPRFAQLNGDHMMYAASLPKIAVLLAAMDAIDKGELKESAEVKRDMRLMISRSDNQASTRMIDRVGFDKIEDVLTDPEYKLYDKQQGGGLWVGKRYGSGGGRHPEPMKGLSHAATSTQVCRFYYLLAEEALVNPERSQQMMNILADPALHHKFVNTLDRIAPEATLFRKSGSWKTYHSDSVMVLGPDRRYILVALIDDPAGESICRELVLEIEKVLAATP